MLKFLGGPVLTQGESEGRESRNRSEERRRELARWSLLAVLIFFSHTQQGHFMGVTFKEKIEFIESHDG